jgi:general secretion pathway protein I
MKKVLAGFTILEVMIAVVILAIGLSALFASEAGAIRMAQKARTSTIATLLARCKMAEIEEKIAKEGWPGELLDGHDECCEDGEKAGYECDWKVERIKLPELSDDKDKKDGDKDIDETIAEASGSGGSGGSSSTTTRSGSGRKGVLDSMAEMSKQGLSGGQSALTEMMSGTVSNKSGGIGSAGRDGLGFTESDGGVKQYQASQNGGVEAIVMNLAFPLMKPVIEEGVRRAQVIVKWKEGKREMTFDVVQYLVTENQIVLPDLADDDDAGVSGSTTNPVTNPGAAVPR